MSHATEGRIPSLDGLRAISISLVLVAHLAGTQYFPVSREVGKFWNLGELGVRVFFVISGFLITGLLLDEIAKSGRIQLGRFFFRRTLRIFPPYYGYLIAMFAAAGLGYVQLAPHDAAHAMTYTSNYYPERSWYVGHTWSLSVEEQFYLLWPAALVLVGVGRGLWIAAAVVLLAPVARLFEWFFVASAAGGIGHRFETVADAIAVGCLLAMTRALLHRTPLYVRALQSPLFVIVPLIAIAGALTHDRPLISFALGMTATNVALALVIDWCVTFHDGRVGRILNAAPLVFVGWISYSLYLWQQPFLNRASNADTAVFPINITLAIGCALLSYFVIERPSLALRKALEKRIFKPATATTAVTKPAQVVASLLLCVALATGASACAAAHGGPVVGGGDPPPEMSGTISGIVRSAASNAPLASRRVTAVETTTGAKYEATTAANGGYTMKVPMGRYRLEVQVSSTEAVSEAPAEVVINRSDLDSGRDFVITIKP